MLARHEIRLVQLRHTGLLDMDGCGIDGSHARALKGEPVDRHGTLLATSLTAR